MRTQTQSRLSRPQAPILARAVMLTVVLSAALAPRASAQPEPLKGLDAYIQKAMSDWEIPGLAIAVVKDGETVWARGFGVRDLRTGEPVDENTIFAIGSSSKAFTAAAVGMLVQEGLLDWDDPATRYLPEFQTSDPYVTRELTVRDLLTHRSGLNRGDQVWYAMDFDREQILRRVRHQPPTSSFRSQFGYNNNMYLAAGQIIEAVTGLTWDQFIERRFFAPLGMERSTTSTISLERMENVAQPHDRIGGKVRPIAWRNIDNIAPAGSINSSVAEMARWVQLLLAGGKWKGQQLLDEAVVRETQSAQTIIPLEPPWSLMAQDAHFLMYGMGWLLHDYRARKIVQHGGNIDGMHALVALMPEENVGLVILTNMPNGLTYALMYRVFDAYLGGPQKDWSARLLEQYRPLIEAAEAQQRAVREARVSGTRPSLPLERYAGTYSHAMYGDVEVTLEGGRLVARRSRSFIGDLEHWHYDTFRIDWRDDALGETFVTFELNARGEVAGADIQGLGRHRRVERSVASGRRETAPGSP